MPIAGLSSERLITNRLGFNKNSLNPACGGREEVSNDGAGVEPVAGYGASPAPFPQFLPRWARAEALDRPTGTTVAALDARRRVPRRPDVVQLDAGEIAGNDRVPLGGRVRSRPRPCSWSTCAGRDSQESGLKALEEPDFAPISAKPASQPARRGPPVGRGSVLVP